MTADSNLTRKQKKVLALWQQGKTPAQIAKALKVGRNGVYTHLRNLREKGYNLDGDEGNTNPAKTKVKVTSNGSGKITSASLQTAISDAAKVAKHRAEQIEKRKAELLNTINEAQREVDALDAEWTAVTAAEDKLASIG